VSDYDEDDDETTSTVVYSMPPPGQRFSLWNLAGTGFTAVAALGQVWFQGLNAVAQGCWDHARWVEQEREIAQAQVEHEEDQRRQLEEFERTLGFEGADAWLGDEIRPEDLR
jgi:hypothetical protein